MQHKYNTTQEKRRLCGPSARSFLRPKGLTQHFLVSDTSKFFLIFWLRIVHFGLVLLWHVIRQFKILVNFLQNFYVHSRPLARSAAHPQLLGLKHGTARKYCYHRSQIRKSHMGFRWVYKIVTLNDLERRNGRYFVSFHTDWSFSEPTTQT